jgi:hypothetical protein
MRQVAANQMEVMVSIRHGIPPFSPILASLNILSNISSRLLPTEILDSIPAA